MDAELLKQIAGQFGFDPVVTGTLVVVIVFLMNAIKDMISPRPIVIALTVFVMAALLNGAVYLSVGNWPGAIIGSFITWGLSIGGWSSVKKVAHKIGK